ncbi:MAG: hypothetical protein ABIH68_00305 [bacterium]
MTEKIILNRESKVFDGKKKIYRNLFSALLLVLFPMVSSAQDIVFVLPKTLKVTTNKVIVKGAVMDFSVDKIDITSLNLIDLVREQEKEEKLRKKEKEKKRTKEKKECWLNTLDYETIPVTNGFFQKSLKIKEGINAVLVKPAEVDASPQNTHMKVIVLDRVSSKIELLQPETDRIAQLKNISGKIVKKPYPETVRVTIEALVADDLEGNTNYKINNLLEATVPVKRKKFKLPVALSELLTGGEIVIITISDDGTQITKTLF